MAKGMMAKGRMAKGMATVRVAGGMRVPLVSRGTAVSRRAAARSAKRAGINTRGRIGKFGRVKVKMMTRRQIIGQQRFRNRGETRAAKRVE